MMTEKENKRTAVVPLNQCGGWMICDYRKMVVGDIPHCHYHGFSGSGMGICTNLEAIEAATNRTKNDLLEALEAILETIPTDDSWWCPHCGPTQMNNMYRCEFCGTRIDECQPDTERIDKARAAIAKAKGE